MKKYFLLVILTCLALSSCNKKSIDSNPPEEELLQKEEAQNKDQKSEVDEIANDSKDLEDKSEDDLKQEGSSSDANIKDSDSKDIENVYVESSFKNRISYKEFVKNDDDFFSYNQFLDYIAANDMVDVDEEDKKAWETSAYDFKNFPTNILLKSKKKGLSFTFL